MKEMLSRKAAHDRMRDRGTSKSTPSSSNSPIPPLATADTTTKETSAFATETVATHQGIDVAKKARISPTPKRNAPGKVEPTAASKRARQAQNFLAMGARKAKAAKSARTAARVGFQPSKKIKLSNTGSGVPLPQVVRLKYVKGFTQAVRTPCRLKDLE